MHVLPTVSLLSVAAMEELGTVCIESIWGKTVFFFLLPFLGEVELSFFHRILRLGYISIYIEDFMMGLLIKILPLLCKQKFWVTDCRVHGFYVML